MHTFVKRFVLQHFLIGEAYPYDYWDGNEPVFFTLLNPELLEVETALGKDFVYMKPSTSIQKILTRDDEAAKELRKYIPNELAKNWASGKKAYLPNAKRYSNLKQYHDKYARSPIEPIFNDLEIMETLQEADYATARKLRQMILHIKVGNKDFRNGKAVPKEVLDKVKEYFNDNDISRAMEMFTQWFVDAEYIYPDVEIFNSKKYEGPRNRIVEWSNMDAFLSQNTSFSEATEKVKALREEIREARVAVRKVLDNFYSKFAEKNGFTYYRDLKKPNIMFDKNPLMDEELVWKVNKFLYQSGLLSIESVMDQYGFDSRSEIEKKLNEQEYEGELYPLYESDQGLLSLIFEENGTLSSEGGE